MRHQNALGIAIAHMGGGVDVGDTRHHAFGSPYGGNEAPVRRARTTPGHSPASQRQCKQPQRPPPVQWMRQGGFKLGKPACQFAIRQGHEPPRRLRTGKPA